MKRWRLRGLASFVPAALIIFAVAGPGAFVCGPAAADDAMEARHLVDKAQQTLENFSRAEDMQSFRNLIKDARGIFVAPQILKGAFIVGAAGGSGVLVARDTLTGRWIGPAFYTMGAVSFGFQIGGSASEVVLLVMTERGVNALLESSIKLGADVGVAAGPVGVGAAASTANLSADIVSFARSKGLYGGISVDGAVIKNRNDWNSAYYGGLVTASDIFRKRTAKSYQSAGLLTIASMLADGVRPSGPESRTDEGAGQPVATGGPSDGKAPAAQTPGPDARAPASDAQAPPDAEPPAP